MNTEPIETTDKVTEYAPLLDGNPVCYLLLYLGVPSNVPASPSESHIKNTASAKRSGKKMGVKIWSMRLLWENGEGYLRYFFRLPRYSRDDELAVRVGESALYAMSVSSGPYLEEYQTLSVFRIPAEIVRGEECVGIEKLVQIEEARVPDDRITDYPAGTLRAARFCSSAAVDEAWRIAPAIFHSESLYHAARFLKASSDQFYIAPGQIDEVLRQPDLKAETGSEQTQMENALQNAFKAVEAVIGDPSKDDRKFFPKLKAVGLHPMGKVDYRTKTPIHQVIRDMNLARDKKSAHGSTSDRMISVCELMEYQACARHVLLSAIEKELGKN
ncbi:hypothetical protein GF348_03850 [candidate division KSB3 bacterium]|nr:hypothetical protein [candidate division KSB3 bacterium]